MNEQERQDQLEHSMALWEEAKKLDQQLPALRRAAFDRIKAEHKGIRYRSWGALRTAERASLATKPYSAMLHAEAEKLDQMQARAKWCRQEGERLGDHARSRDSRRILDPKSQPIPADGRQKLRDCSQYPLRESCNFGENDEARWLRCEFMTYNSSGDASGNPWTCSARQS